MQQRAFSLVELSIVLVILGLLVGGILAGQSLIRASEVRAVMADYQRYLTATHAFRDKYFFLPGDLPNATNIWGAFGTGTCPTGSGTGTQTCNGNGDGVVSSGATAAEANEMFLYWQHLANAGLVEGTYTGKAGASGAQEAALGTNVPRSKFPNTGWTGQGVAVFSNANWLAVGDYGHVLMFGAPYSGNKTVSGTGVLTPAEAWNLDTKLDDGRAGIGKVLTYTATGAFAPGCGTTDVASTTEYALTNSNKICSLIFRNAF